MPATSFDENSICDSLIFWPSVAKHSLEFDNWYSSQKKKSLEFLPEFKAYDICSNASLKDSEAGVNWDTPS